MKLELQYCLILLVIPFLLFVMGCKKHKTNSYSDNGLPPATQEGANIFACRVNGKVWIAQRSIYNIGTSFSKNNSRDTLSFFASDPHDSILTDIIFTINEKIHQGATYRLNDTTKASVNTLRLFAPCGSTSGYGDAQWNYATDGHITITKFSGTYTVPSCCTYGTYDPEAIISGTFSFVIVIPNCDSIKVTDGRFDINYSQY